MRGSEAGSGKAIQREQQEMAVRTTLLPEEFQTARSGAVAEVSGCTGV